MLLKYFGLKTIKIETASNNPNGLNDMKLIGIINPEEYRNKILSVRNKLNNYTRNFPEESSQKEVVELLKDIKEILLNRN